MFRSEYCYVAHTQVGFAVTSSKGNKEPEFARWRYQVKIDVEETKSRAENLGFSCRLLEGQPQLKKHKIKKNKDGCCEPYPLPEYEITGGELSHSAKIQIAPKTTQIFFFGPELIKPIRITFEELQPFVDRISVVANDLEKAENLMNELAAFVDDEQGRFGQATRIYVKVPAMYRLIIASNDVYQQLLDDIMTKFLNEYILAFDEMLQGKISFARRRMDDLLKEIVFFQRSLIATAKEMKDPRAEQWEADLNTLLTNPFGFASLGLRKTQLDNTP